MSPYFERAHDFRVDIVITPDEVLRTDARHRSTGVIWEHLDDETVDAIPVLAARRSPQGSTRI